MTDFVSAEQREIRARMTMEIHRLRAAIAEHDKHCRCTWFASYPLPPAAAAPGCDHQRHAQKMVTTNTGTVTVCEVCSEARFAPYAAPEAGPKQKAKEPNFCGHCGMPYCPACNEPWDAYYVDTTVPHCAVVQQSIAPGDKP